MKKTRSKPSVEPRVGRQTISRRTVLRRRNKRKNRKNKNKNKKRSEEFTTKDSKGNAPKSDIRSDEEDDLSFLDDMGFDTYEGTEEELRKQIPDAFHDPIDPDQSMFDLDKPLKSEKPSVKTDVSKKETKRPSNVETPVVSKDDVPVNDGPTLKFKEVNFPKWKTSSSRLGILSKAQMLRLSANINSKKSSKNYVSYSQVRRFIANALKSKFGFINLQRSIVGTKMYLSLNTLRHFRKYVVYNVSYSKRVLHNVGTIQFVKLLNGRDLKRALFSLLQQRRYTELISVFKRYKKRDYRMSPADVLGYLY